MVYQIEHVARAFYDTVHDGKLWDLEFEIIKEEFRAFAREAVNLLHQHQERSLMEAFCSVAIPKGRVEISSAA